MAMGRFNTTSSVITTATTTDLITPAAYESIYVLWLGIDVSVAGTTTTAQVKAQTTARTLGLFATTAVGHQESYFCLDRDDTGRGFFIPIGEKLQVTTIAGGGAATLTVTVIYDLRGGAF